MTSPTAAGQGGAGGPSRPVSVVVVDDDEASLRILETFLRRDGCAVRTFQDPRAALAAMASAPPDVLVSDWLMEGMNGPDLLRAVRASPALQGTYCILVTAHDAGGRKVTGLLVGADDYLAKPVSETELLARIRVGLRVRRLEREAMMAAVAATLGHEVNNPLTGVFGFLDLARTAVKEGRSAEALASLEGLEEAAERIRVVVARILETRDPGLRTVRPGVTVLDGNRGG